LEGLISHRPAPGPHLRTAPAAALRAIQTVLTDIDGTMTRAGRIPAEVIAAAGAFAAAGVEVFPVTGRSAGEALGLARYIPAFRRAIAENGGVLVVPDRPIRFLRPAVDAAQLARAAQVLGGGAWRLAPCSAFRLTDQAFERDGRSDADLDAARHAAAQMDLCLTWSSVHIHLTLQPPDKGAGALAVLAEHGADPQTALAIGDAPNDEGLWHAGRFGLTVGTADVLHCWPRLRHRPEYTVGPAGEGWCEMAAEVLQARGILGGNGSPPGSG